MILWYNYNKAKHPTACIYYEHAVDIHTVSKIMKTIYMSDVQVAFQFYGHFRCLQVLYSIKLHLPNITLLSGFQSSLGDLKSPD